MEKKIAIILVNYNGIDDTIDCIESIYKNKNENYNIIVVDNASKDKEGEEIAKKYNDVKVINSNKNLGFSGGNNLGIDEKMIDYLLEYANEKTIAVPKMYYYSERARIWYGRWKNKQTNRKCRTY